MIADMKITKTQFNRYEGCRLSGVTNMFNVRLVEELSGLTKDKIMTIMKEYGTLKEKYGDE